ncbi:hypothetical protein AXF42_Ash003748 [Apostasia shenzhenica]|uniref:Uncharacterized protein n=1 Tax=Apostasia shenzhenica TaxID=1088818 RepID=A0A2I0AHS6_9ASPA|nr:hypothetical protein AXF42_Ash003748 [Apostasia shenzhenica]
MEYSRDTCSWPNTSCSILQALLFHIPRKINSLADELAKKEKRDAQDILSPAYDNHEVFNANSNFGSWMDGIQCFL